jgi:hypothetical protein
MSSNEYASTLRLGGGGGEEQQPLTTRRGSADNSWTKEDLPKEVSVFSTMSTRGAQSIMHQERKENILRRIQDSSNRSLVGGGGGGVNNETTSLLTLINGSSSRSLATSSTTAVVVVPPDPYDSLKEMILDNKIHVLFAFIPLAYLSHTYHWGDGYIFILNFLAMIPLASLLGVFTEELAAHTNDVIGGLINATFGNAVELVVAIQALLHGGKYTSFFVLCDYINTQYRLLHTNTDLRSNTSPSFSFFFFFSSDNL